MLVGVDEPTMESPRSIRGDSATDAERGRGWAR
jgi:hypothetical protein